jgi:hypothetical protein
VSGRSSENGICGCGLPAHCCQPAVGGCVIYADLCGELSTHLAPQALFTQSSPVCEPLLQAFPFPSTLENVTLHSLSQACMFIYSSCGKWVFPLSCAVFLPPPLLQAFLLLITGRCCCSCQPPCLFTAHVESGSFPLSCGVFLLLPLSQAFPLLVAGRTTPLPLEPLLPAWLVYLQFQEGFPSPNLRHSVHPTLFATCLYCSYCLLLSFSFFPGGRSVCPGGYAALAQACLWEYRCTVKLTLSVSSQAIWAWATGSLEALLVSPFNVKWRCSAPAGGVKESKFCLFLVVLPARCLQRLSKISLQEARFLLPPSSCHLGISTHFYFSMF